MRQHIFLTVFSFVLFSGQVIAEGVRGELQIGASFGEPEIEVGGLSEELDTDTGITFGVSVWWDEIYTEYFSLGLQYNYTTGADFKESGNFLGATINVSVEHDVHSFMANAVFRDNTGTVIGGYRFHPYIGGGLGLAQVDAEISASGMISGTTIPPGSVEDDDLAFAMQAMGGLDIDITDRAYIGFNGSYLSAETDLFGADVNFDGWRVMGAIGYKF